MLPFLLVGTPPANGCRSAENGCVVYNVSRVEYFLVMAPMTGRVMGLQFQLGVLKEEEEVGSCSWFTMEEEERM